MSKSKQSDSIGFGPLCTPQKKDESFIMQTSSLFSDDDCILFGNDKYSDLSKSPEKVSKSPKIKRPHSRSKKRPLSSLGNNMSQLKKVKRMCESLPSSPNESKTNCGSYSSEDEDSPNLTIVEKKKRNKSFDAKDIPESLMDIIIKSGIDNNLSEKAEKKKLTPLNVKDIIKHIITDEDVKLMVRNTMLGLTEQMNFEPKLTRARTKEIQAQHLRDNETTPTWNGSVGSDPADPQTFVAMDLPEEECDEEYHPENDEQLFSDEESAFSSCFGSPNSSFCSVNQSVNTPGSTKSSTPKPNQSPATQIGNFKIPSMEVKSAQRVLQFNKQKEEQISFRTRSKFSLGDTALESLEMAFIPPDITPDMYETECEDEEWKKFLLDFVKPPDALEHTEEDEHADPEYDLLKAAEDEAPDFTDLHEEMRKDRAVRVSKREFNMLMDEFLNSFQVESDDEQENNTAVANNTSIKNKKDDVMAVQNNPYYLERGITVEFLIPQFSSENINILKSQLIQHVQLITTSVLMCHNIPNKTPVTNYLSGWNDMLGTFGELSKESMQSMNTLFNPFNLQPALDTIKKYDANKLQNQDCYSSNFGNSLKIIPKFIKSLILDSSAFPFPQLLPTRMFTLDQVKFTMFLDSEDMLLAMTLYEQAQLLNLSTISNRIVEQLCKKIRANECPLLFKSHRQVKERWKYLKRPMNLKLKANNPVVHFLNHGSVPVPRAKPMILPPSVPCPLRDVNSKYLPDLWARFKREYWKYSSNDNQFSSKVKNIIIVQSPINGTQIIIPPPSFPSRDTGQFIVENNRGIFDSIEATSFSEAYAKPVATALMNDNSSNPVKKVYTKKKRKSKNNLSAIEKTSPILEDNLNKNIETSDPRTVEINVNDRDVHLDIAKNNTKCDIDKPEELSLKNINVNIDEEIDNCDIDEDHILNSIEESPNLKSAMSVNNSLKHNSGNEKKSSKSQVPEVTRISSPIPPILSNAAPSCTTIMDISSSRDSPTLNMPLLFNTPRKESDSAQNINGLQNVNKPNSSDVSTDPKVTLTSENTGVSTKTDEITGKSNAEPLVFNATILNPTDSNAILQVIQPRVRYRPIAKSPYTALPTPFKTSDLQKTRKKIPAVKRKPQKPTFIRPKGVVKKLRSKPLTVEIAPKFCEQIDKKRSESRVVESNEGAVSKLATLDSKEDDVDEELFGQDETEEIDQQEQHLQAFLKASSTIVQKERRSSQSGPGSKTDKGQTLNPQQRKLQARVNDLSGEGNMKTQNKVLAQDYLNRVAQVGDAVFKQFLQLLQNFDPSKETPVQLYERAKVILKDHPSLHDGFMVFLKPEESIEVNQFDKFCTIEKMREFLDKLQRQFGSNSLRVSKFLQCLQTLQSTPSDFSFEKLEEVMKPILRYPHLNEAFMRCFPSSPPIESLSSDFEQIDLDNSPVDGFETIDMTQDEISQNPSDQCTCKCHPENRSDSSDKMEQKPTRSDHCVSCGLRFIDGRVYLQCGKILKPAKVTYLIGKKDEEPPKPKEDKKDAKRKLKK